MKIVLASASPRRKELLSTIIRDFEVVTAPVEEVRLRSPWRTVMHNAVLKGSAVKVDADIVVSADTGVFLRGKFFGKPKDADEAFAMLKALNGKYHTVWTAVAVQYKVADMPCIKTVAVHSRVKLCFDSDEAIRAYIATGSPLDKAGAYGIQGKGSVLVKGIVGDYFNVMGLPVAETARFLGLV